MYCLYQIEPFEADVLPGPLQMKVLDGVSVIAFTTRDLAARFAFNAGIPDEYHIVPLDALGTTASPFPKFKDGSERNDTMIIFEREETLWQYFENMETFPYKRHLDKLPVRRWWHRILPARRRNHAV